MNEAETPRPAYTRPAWTSWVPSLLALVLGLACIVLVRLESSPILVAPRLYVLVVPLLLLLIGWFLSRRAKEEPDGQRLFASTILLLAGLYLVSSGIEFIYAFLMSDAGAKISDSRMSAQFIHTRLGLFIGATVVLFAGLLVFRKHAWWRYLLGGLLLFGIGYCASGMWMETGGEAIYRDDHPSFMQRLWIFGQTFPQILYYDPYWDAGKAQSYLVSSGTTAPGLLAWPLWRFFEAHEVYTPGLIWLYLVVSPLVLMAAVRLVRGNWTAVLTAGVLGLCATRYLWLWQLHYGTLGFSVAMPFLVLTFACLYRVMVLERLEWWNAILLVLSGFLYLSWPAGIIFAVLPILFVVVPRMFYLKRKQWLFLIGCAAVLGLLLLPHLLAVLNHSRLNKLDGIEKESLPMLGILRDQILRGHPWIFLAGLIGVIGLRTPHRWFFGSAIVGLLLATVVGGALKPQFELERASVPLFMMGIVPAALLLASWLDSRRRDLAAPAALGMALLIPCILSAGDAWQNKALECYKDSDVRPDVGRVTNTRFAYIDDFVNWVETEAKDGRIAFLGPTKASYARAHSAYLPIWTQHPMLSCDYYDFPPGLVELDMPPTPYRQGGVAGWKSWMALFNIRYCVTYHSGHLDSLRRFPAQFTEIFEFGEGRKFYVFEVKDEPTWFFDRTNGGSVEAGVNRISVKLDNNTEPATLRFNWEDGLVVNSPAEIRPASVKVEFPWTGTTGTNWFIKIIPNGEQDIEIRYRRWH